MGCVIYRSNVNDDQEKPRSLRFTWSMKTTSSRDPNEIMMEIRKVFTLPHINKNHATHTQKAVLSRILFELLFILELD